MEESNYFVKTDPSEKPENNDLIFLNYGGNMYIGNYNSGQDAYFVGGSVLQDEKVNYWLKPI